ncbi:MAG: hypothetical protein M1812_004721 [Candelaria pacifica]|nr:MAG: hypothetical protein M1812_004721 [Candelaria pacifica]
MAVRGERFSIDLSSTEGYDDPSSTDNTKSGSPAFALEFLGDIQERIPSSSPTAPLAPRPKNSTTGFPAHRNREHLSTFRNQRVKPPIDPSNQPKTTTGPKFAETSGTSAPSQDRDGAAQVYPRRKAYDEVERSRIDNENRQRIAGMCGEEIERERQELISGMSPSLIEGLLKRANIDEGREDTYLGPVSDPDIDAKQSAKPRKSVTFDVPHTAHSSIYPDAAPTIPPTGLHPASYEHNVLESSTLSLPSSVHFPRQPNPPDLDPDDPSFLSNLQEKYFPTLSADPSKLAWMAPIPNPDSAADNESPYSPSQESLSASAIRFDFRGALLPPRTAREIPVTKGLHHHGEAPEAAGYTLPELARLGRSTFSAQRCVAFQTLGRILYRLGKGIYGDEGSELSMGLWRCVEQCKILQIIQEEASSKGGHLSAQAYATEAVWNWQKGGGRRWKAA